MKIALTHNLQRHETEEEAEFDSPETIASLCAAMERLGHEVTPIDVAGPVSELVARLERLAPELVVNTAEGWRGRTREAFYPALFEQLGLAYTGSDAFACTVTLDKHLSKMIVAAVGVPTPRWRFVESAADLDALDGAGLRAPYIVKPNAEGSSKGITGRSIVRDPAELRARTAEWLARYPEGVLVEEFIEGVDVAVPFIEGVSPETQGILPAVLYQVDGGATLYDFDLKHQDSDRVHVHAPAPLPQPVLDALAEHSARVVRSLGVRDVGRLDWRVTPDGEIAFLEINALPSLEEGAGIYVSAALVGLPTPEAVLDAVIKSACVRRGLLPADAPARSGARVTPRKARVGLVYNLKRHKPTAEDDGEAEFDSQETVDAIAAALAQGGHEVVRLEADAALPSKLRGDDGPSVDVVFNIAEGWHGRTREAIVPALCDAFGIEHTGSDATTLALTLDKGLAKRLVRDAGVRTPTFLVMRTGKERLPADLRFPVMVKPNAEGSSKGVDEAGVVHDEATLRARVATLGQRYRQGVLVEEFLSGREFTVGLLGHPDRPRVLPIMEIVFDQALEFPVYTFAHKQATTDEVRYDVPAVLTDALRKDIERLARAAWRALGCRDVGRIDVRLDADGRPCFIECNPLPGLTPKWSDLCMIAAAEPLSYEELIAQILAPALRRWRATRSTRPAGGAR